MSHLTLLCLAFGTAATLGVAASAAAAQPTLSRVGGAAAVVYEPAEWTLDVPGGFANPFDPDVVAADVTFIGPGGATLKMPAYWDGEADAASTRFRVRFSPIRAGDWSATPTVKTAGGSEAGAAVTFRATAGKSPGFVRVADNGRYFRRDDGSSYFPVGLNLAWPSGTDDGRVEVYRQYFESLSKNGGNIARLWMGNRQMMIEPDTLARYNLPTARAWDGIFQEAQARGVGVMLCLMNHREFLDRDSWGPANWPISPYNAANGGPAKTPGDFFTDPEARRFFRARLRYLAARYGAFTSVMCWELMNEQEFAKVGDLEAWNAEMMAYLHQVDPFDHLVTTSADVADATNADPRMAFTHAHLYGDGTQPQMLDAVVDAVRRHARFGKPVVISEIGLDGGNGDEGYDPRGVGTPLHNALWSAALSGSAGGSMHWWWDKYVGPLDLWHEYAALSQFAATVDWAGRDYRPLDLPVAYRAKVPADATADATLAATLNWAKMDPAVVQVDAGGNPDRALPRYLIGASKTDLSAPLTLALDMPAAGVMTLRFSRVSDYAVVRVGVDDKPVGDVMLSALPAAPGDVKPNADGIYQSDVNSERSFPLPAGTHRVTIETIAGDWAMLGGVKITNAVRRRNADLTTLALRDDATSDTLVWLLDRTSNHLQDAQGGTPRTLADVRLEVPVAPSVRRCDVVWWDTRIGRTTSAKATASDGVVTLDVPPFRRDLAVRVTPQQP